MVLPGLNSVIVPEPSVVVVVVVVSDTCAQAKGAAIANAMLNTTFFIFALSSILPSSDRVRFRTQSLIASTNGTCTCETSAPAYENAGFNQVRRESQRAYSDCFKISLT